MKYRGKINIETIEEEITNPTLEIKTVFLEVIFKGDNGLKHSRQIEVSLDTINLDEAIKSNEILKQFS